MSRKCQVCGEEMVYKVGEHYRHTPRGMVLYRDVRQYTCPRGCPGAYFDFRYAHPVDQPLRILGFIPVPKKPVNIVDPLLYGGLVAAYLLFVVGTLMTLMPVAVKAVVIVAVTVLGGLLFRFMRGKAPEPGEERP